MTGDIDLPPGGIAWDETLELEAPDGVGLRGAVWRGGDRGLVLLLNGRTEFLEKCAVPAAELVRRGFDVASLDWRGQGRSDRMIDPPLKGHVENFTDFHRDLETLLAHPAVAGTAGRRLMLAHSMGGAIGLGAVLRGDLAVDAAILTAPMLGIEMGWLASVSSGLVLRLAGLMGRMERWPPFGPVDQPYVFSGYHGNVLTSDRATFDWMAAALRRQPALQLGMPTLGWMDAAMTETAWIAGQAGLGFPALCLLGSDEAVVDADVVRSVSRQLGAELVEIADARHEILIEADPMRGQGWAAIDRFLQENGF